MRRTSRLTATLTAGLVTAALAATGSALPSASAADSPNGVLRSYAEDTWRSMAAMVDSRTGLVSDNIGGQLDADDRAAYTSPTNIGAYMWSAIAARDIGIISADEARERIAQSIAGVAALEKHEPSGMFYNWYDPATGAKLTTWPADGSPVFPFLSSVDNGWLATALTMVTSEVPVLSDEAHAVLDDMDFGYYYNPAENQIRGGFWLTPRPGSIEGNYRGGEPVHYTGHHYGAFNTEPRMASYLGIASGQIPQKHYFGTWRTFPSENCDWSWTEQRAVGRYAEYMGVRVFEGAYKYAGRRLIPTWGGSMFEALMVPLFVPEEEWGDKSWALTHPTYVRAQIEHGMDEAKYGYWGFSPSNNPAGGYREYGVDPIGMEPNGYASDQERTFVDYGYGDCRPAQKEPSKYGQGVVTPHASFLAYRYAPKAALTNLANLREDFGAYGPGGFYDAINVRTGQMSERYLSLDQGMVMAALGNALAGDDMRRAFSTGPMKDKVEPLMRMEEFTGITEGTP
ncbi:MAG TPA: glucoamylase family protein [Actinomycetes bacterium]